MKKHTLIHFLATAGLAAAAFGAQAQATVKEDGQWRSAIGLGFSNTSGNSKGTSLTLTGDAVRATKADKWSIYGNTLYTSSNSVTTGNQMRLGTRYDWKLSERLFWFGNGDFETDKVAGLSSRLGLGGGLGYNIIKSNTTTFDVFAGIGQTSDQYKTARLIDGRNRTSYSYGNLLLGEESTHKLSDTVSAKQRFVLYPNMKQSGEYRAQFDAGLAVAMSKAMNLNVGFAARINSDPGVGRKKNDTLLTTGISVKFD